MQRKSHSFLYHMLTKVEEGGLPRVAGRAQEVSRMTSNKRCLFNIPLIMVMTLGGIWVLSQLKSGRGFSDVQVRQSEFR